MLNTTPTTRPIPTLQQIRNYAVQRYLADHLTRETSLSTVAEVFRCSLGDLVRANLPAVVEITLPEVRDAALRIRDELNEQRRDYSRCEEHLDAASRERDIARSERDAAIAEATRLRAELAALNARVSAAADRAERLARVHPAPEQR